MKDIVIVNNLEELILKNYSGLTKGQKKIADYIIKFPEEVAFLTSRGLGKKVGVSDATVIRLSRILGSEGFANLQEILQSWLKANVIASEKLRGTKIRQRGNVYEIIFQMSLTNITKSREKIPTAKLKELIDCLDQAKRIFVVGLRRSYALAFYLYYNLSRILKNAFLIESSYGIMYDQIIDIDNRDVLISISFPRYTKETLEITRFAKKQRACIVAITDDILSPIAQLADISMCPSCSSPFFFGTHVGTLFVIECIIGGLSLKHKKRYINALARLENLFKDAGIWIK